MTGVQADSATLDELDHLFDPVRKEKGAVNVLWASAGMGRHADTKAGVRRGDEGAV
jgi:NAD(P)-dependent dehydrogenase (short-subunit alcohol dehydrogenase family)